MKQYVYIFLFLFLPFFMLSAQETNNPGAEEHVKDRNVETLDLGEAGKDKLKLGLSLGYPMSGITAGWQVGESLELDVLAGSGWDYKYVGLGASAMFSLVNIKISEEIFPLTAGPFVYVGLGSNYLGLSAGAMVRMEYTFDFRLNFYLESGLSVNFFSMAYGQNIPIGFPTSLGIRYIF